MVPLDLRLETLIARQVKGLHLPGELIRPTRRVVEETTILI